jgi:CubicO group peptidase (beta-lactamase class C family)
MTVHAVIALCAVPLALCPLPAQNLPTDSAVLAIIKPRVDTGRYAGLVVGLVDRTGRVQVTAYGPRAGVTPFDGNTVFEIGSVTKTFTGGLLAEMVSRRDVSLDDPVARHLPPGTAVPMRDGREITLLDLATQTSGLPRLPGNLRDTDPKNPYAAYTTQQLYEFLAGYSLPRAIGAQYEYSNLGMGLLGQALAHRVGMSWEDLAINRLLEPLTMNDTRISLTTSMQRRLAPGHDEAGARAGLWDLPAIAGAGALRSTVNDMLKYVRANADSMSHPLGRSFAAAHRARRNGPAPNVQIGLAWHRTTLPAGPTIVWHNGGTGGYRSFAGFNEATGRGVVVLTNTAVGVDDIGMHLLDASVPLAPIPKRRVAIALPADVLQRYVGEYELAPTFIITITRDGNALFAQPSGQPRLPIFAESETQFFLRAVDAQLTFNRDASGAVTGLTLHQNGQNLPGRRR